MVFVWKRERGREYRRHHQRRMNELYVHGVKGLVCFMPWFIVVEAPIPNQHPITNLYGTGFFIMLGLRAGLHYGGEGLRSVKNAWPRHGYMRQMVDVSEKN
jgi:hypothetical protein